jgi:anti-anti-sigma regulatory factor
MALTTSTESVAARVPLTVLTLEGELDASNFESVVAEVRSLYVDGSRQLLIDLTGLTFLASSGLVALHSIILVMRGEVPSDPESGWDAFHTLGAEVSSGSTQSEVQLCGPQPGVARVLSRTGLDRLFRIHPDRATAIAAF